MKVCFICTKPLQIMISMIISEQFADADLVLVDDFEGVHEILLSEDLRRYFKNVSISRSRQAAIIEMAGRDYTRVFIDSDVGLHTHLALFLCKLRSPALKFSVYEEGIGTYRNDLVTGIAKGLLYRFLGAGRYFGASAFVSEIYCFQPARYVAVFPRNGRSVRGIDTCFVDWLFANQRKLLRIFPGLEEFSLSGTERIFLYLTNWELNPTVIESLGLNGNLLVKPHPHLKYDVVKNATFRLPDITLVPGGVPAEVLIVYLLGFTNELFVLHSGSSVAHYLGSMKSVNFIDIRSKWNVNLDNLGISL